MSHVFCCVHETHVSLRNFATTHVAAMMISTTMISICLKHVRVVRFRKNTLPFTIIHCICLMNDIVSNHYLFVLLLVLPCSRLLRASSKLVVPLSFSWTFGFRTFSLVFVHHVPYCGPTSQNAGRLFIFPRALKTCRHQPLATYTTKCMQRATCNTNDIKPGSCHKHGTSNATTKGQHPPRHAATGCRQQGPKHTRKRPMS